VVLVFISPSPDRYLDAGNNNLGGPRFPGWTVNPHSGPYSVSSYQ
jgi:hypothetical protein